MSQTRHRITLVSTSEATTNEGTAVGLIILIVVIAALWLVARASGGFGELVDRLINLRIGARVSRLRAAGHGRIGPARIQWRLTAGLVDLAGAAVLGAFLTAALGLGRTTTYLPDGTSEASTSIDFSAGLFPILVLVAYVSEGWHAAVYSDEGQTFGQRLYDYAPRGADGRGLNVREVLTRHMLRPLAAPGALRSRLDLGNGLLRHDEWTQTRPVMLGAAQPEGESLGASASTQGVSKTAIVPLGFQSSADFSASFPVARATPSAAQAPEYDRLYEPVDGRCPRCHVNDDPSAPFCDECGLRLRPGGGRLEPVMRRRTAAWASVNPDLVAAWSSSHGPSAAS